MAQQLTLFEAPQPDRPKYSLFLAIFPDRLTAQHISELAMKIRETHGLRGRTRPLNHLHVTLHFPIRCSEVAVCLVGQICKEVAALVPPFEIKFDRMLSFRGGIDNRPLVMVNHGDGNAALTRLHQALGAEMIGYWRRSDGNLRFNPHITLLYDRQGIPEEPIDPVSWMVDEIVLVRSEVGATKYERLGHWKFVG